VVPAEIGAHFKGCTRWVASSPEDRNSNRLPKRRASLKN